MIQDSASRGSTVAPPDRASEAELLESIEIISNNPITSALLKAFNGVVLVLNPQRQIVAMNSELAHVVGGGDMVAGLGLSPGEMLGCSQAENLAGGCGLGEACASCGCAQAVVRAGQSGVGEEREFLVDARRDGVSVPLEFLARATPITLEGRDFVVLSLRDISAEKRRRALEQVFFHDLLNTAGGLRGWAELMQMRARKDDDPAMQRITALTYRLVDEVKAHRNLLEAESGILDPVIEPVPIADVLDEVGALFANHPAAENRTLLIDPAPDGAELVTSLSLLERVLVNMVKNALEAVTDGGTVRLWYEIDEVRGTVSFLVHNPGRVPRSVEPWIFQRSFSTKNGRGRGLGTYGMKLFGERYLGGEVGFDSSEQGGTVFRIVLPRILPPRFI